MCLKTIFTLLVTLITVSANNYYVSPNGNDSNSGRVPDSAWKTISYATCGGSYLCPCVSTNKNTIKAGDTLWFMEGVYDVSNEIAAGGAITFSNSGTVSKPIVLKNYNNQNVVIDGKYQNIIFWVGKYADNDNLIFDGLTITRGKIAGVFIGQREVCSNITIQNCTITDIKNNDNTGCVYLSNAWDNVTVKNCVLDCGIDNGAGVIIFKGSNNCSIINNEIRNSIFAVYFKHSASDTTVVTKNVSLIRNNYIHDISHIGLHVTADRVIIKNNFIQNAGTVAIGIYLGIGSTCEYAHADSCVIDSNTIIGTSGVYLGDPKECKVKGARRTTVTNNYINSKSNLVYALWEYGTKDSLGGHKSYSSNNVFISSALKPFCEYHVYYTYAEFKQITGQASNSYYNDTSKLGTIGADVSKIPLYGKSDEKKNDILLKDNFNNEQNGCGCGVDAGIAFLPPIFFRIKRKLHKRLSGFNGKKNTTFKKFWWVIRG
jgi:uncharacterized Zn-binding protein involved in type VI secretion